MKVRIIGCANLDEDLRSCGRYPMVCHHDIGQTGWVVAVKSELLDLRYLEITTQDMVNPEIIEKMDLAIIYTVMLRDGSRRLALNEELAFL